MPVAVSSRLTGTPLVHADVGTQLSHSLSPTIGTRSDCDSIVGERAGVRGLKFEDLLWSSHSTPLPRWMCPNAILLLAMERKLCLDLHLLSASGHWQADSLRLFHSTRPTQPCSRSPAVRTNRRWRRSGRNRGRFRFVLRCCPRVPGLWPGSDRFCRTGK